MKKFFEYIKKNKCFILIMLILIAIWLAFMIIVLHAWEDIVVSMMIVAILLVILWNMSHGVY